MVEKPQQRRTLRQRFESFYRGVNFESLLGLDLFSVLPTLLECSALMMGLIKKPRLLTLACRPWPVYLWVLNAFHLSPQHFKMVEIKVPSCCSCRVSGSFVFYLHLKYLFRILGKQETMNKIGLGIRKASLKSEVKECLSTSTFRM